MKKQMNTYFSTILAIILLASGSLVASAQQNDAARKREIRDKAYSLIADTYDTYATINNDEARYTFLRMFVDEEVPVYNDLLGLSTAATLPVADYVKVLLNSKATAKRIKIKNIQLEGEPRQESGKWKVAISFDKEMSYYDKCGIYFSSREFYKADYHLTAQVIYDNVDGRCRIERIDGSIASTAKLPNEYFVFQQSDPRDLQLLYHKQPLMFNGNRQAFVSGQFDEFGFTHPRYTVSKLMPAKDNCNIVRMGYGHRPGEVVKQDGLMALRLHFGLGLGNALSLTGNNGVSGDKASATNFGVDFGYQVAKADMFTLRAFAGLGLSMYSLDFGYGPFEYHYEAPGTADADGDKYTRYYEGLNVSQSLKLTELSIPIYVDAELSFSPMFSAYADLGLQFNLNMSSKTEIGSATASKIYGRYSQYGNMVFDDEWGFNDFSSTTTALSNTTTDDVTGVKSLTMDLLAGVGVRCNIPDSPFAIDLGVDMRMGLGDIVTPDKVENNNLVEYTAKFPNKGTEHLRIVNEIESVKRSSLRLNIGLIYKF